MGARARPATPAAQPEKAITADPGLDNGLIASRIVTNDIHVLIKPEARPADELLIPRRRRGGVQLF